LEVTEPRAEFTLFLFVAATEVLDGPTEVEICVKSEDSLFFSSKLMLDFDNLLVLVLGIVDPFRLCLLLLMTEVPVEESEDR
jgi:hypothetical protein